MNSQQIEQAGKSDELPEAYRSFPINCPCCGNGIAIVGTRLDGLVVEVLEAHCNVCGFSMNPDGTLRAVPTYQHLLDNGWLLSAQENGIPLIDYAAHYAHRRWPNIWADGRPRTLSSEP